MFLAMHADYQYSVIFFQRTCLDGTESTSLTNDVKGKYWKPYLLIVTFADTKHCQKNAVQNRWKCNNDDK